MASTQCMGSLHIPPRCEVHWAGFMSDTYTLQSFGWEAAMEHATNQALNCGSLNLMLRHRAAGWTMYAQSADDYGRMRAMAHLEYGAYGEKPPRFEVRQCRPDDRMVVINGYSSHDWGQIDLHPSRDFEQVPVSKLNIFAPWEPARQEIIVAPDQVADLLERIHKLQEPELQAIRERNRARDHHERAPEIRHATILSIAA